MEMEEQLPTDWAEDDRLRRFWTVAACGVYRPTRTTTIILIMIMIIV